MYRLQTNRSLTKFILLGILTLGIYPIVVFTKVSMDINTIASKYDNRSTMNYCLIFFIFTWLTLGIAPLVWFTRLSSRIGREQCRRNLPVTMSAATFWGWNILGVIIMIGPFVYIYKLLHAMNDLSANYNQTECAA